jgi:hypothetical protein
MGHRRHPRKQIFDYGLAHWGQNGFHGAQDTHPKAIICEKPFTDEFKKAEDIIFLSKKNKKKIYVNYFRRSIPSFLKLLKYLNKPLFELFTNSIPYLISFASNFELEIMLSTVFKLALNRLKCSSAFSLLLKAPLIVKTSGNIIAILINVKSIL